jgi:effector-binding domain-containing protein
MAASVAHVIALYPEMPRDEFPVDVCLPVAPGVPGSDDVALEEIPAVEAAVLVHTGPYASMEPSWRRLIDWVGAAGPGLAARCARSTSTTRVR